MKLTPEGVVDLSQFREKKQQESEDAKPKVEPFFKEPTIVTLADGSGENQEFMLLVNLVYGEKQILALESTSNKDDGIAVVEAIIENDLFTGVKAVETEEEYLEIVEVLQDVLASKSEKGDENVTH